MDWINRLFGKPRNPHYTVMDIGTPKSTPPPSPASAPPDPIAQSIQKQIQDNLELLKFLCTSGKFDRDKLHAFTALSAKLGRPFDADAVRQMEMADSTIGGYEQLRMETMIPTAMKAHTTFFKILAEMRPNPATVRFLADAQRQFVAIGTPFFHKE